MTKMQEYELPLRVDQVVLGQCAWLQRVLVRTCEYMREGMSTYKRVSLTQRSLPKKEHVVT